MANVDISSIIKRKDEAGAKGYWFITDKQEDKTARINSIELGRIKTFFIDMKKVGTISIEACLSHPACIWSKKTTFLNDLRSTGITNEEAYTFILSQKKGMQASIQEDCLERLTLFMIGIAPNMTPKALGERLFINMAIEYKNAAITRLEELESNNGRDEHGWIIATQANGSQVVIEPIDGEDDGHLTEPEAEIDLEAFRRVLEADAPILEERLKEVLA